MRSTAGIYLRTSADPETPCSQPCIWCRCTIPPCWRTRLRDTCRPGRTRSRLETKAARVASTQIITAESRLSLCALQVGLIVHLHISDDQQMVQTQACSSGRCRSLHCSCKSRQGTRCQSHTRPCLTRRHNVQTLSCC